MTTATGPHGFPAVTADPQRRSWVEGGKGGRWTCTCGKSTSTKDAGALHDFVAAHGHAEAR